VRPIGAIPSAASGAATSTAARATTDAARVGQRFIKSGAEGCRRAWTVGIVEHVRSTSADETTIRSSSERRAVQIPNIGRPDVRLLNGSEEHRSAQISETAARVRRSAAGDARHGRGPASGSQRTTRTHMRRPA
jgi:hypothetical protein